MFSWVAQSFKIPFLTLSAPEIKLIALIEYLEESFTEIKGFLQEGELSELDTLVTALFKIPSID